MRAFEGLDRRASATADLGITLRAGLMLLRGLLHKPMLGRSSGPLFVGRGARLHNRRFIRHRGRLVVEDGAVIQGVSTHGIWFGNEVSIGPRVAIRPSSFYGGQAGYGMVVGDRSSFATDCFIGCSGKIVIGDDVMFGPGVRVYAENHVFDRTDVPIKDQGVLTGSVTIGDDCWIGGGVTIASGVTIGRGVVVGAGSVVTRDIPDYAIAAGVPARVIRLRRQDEPTP